MNSKSVTNKTNKTTRKKVLIPIVLSIVFIYILFTIFLILHEETDTFIVKEGTLYNEETVVGYIIRNEKVIENSEANGIIPIVNEGERVSKNESIFQYYNNSQEEIEKQISEIDNQIQETLKTESIDTTADIKTIENQIENIVEQVKSNTDIKKISEYNKQIQSLLTKKIDFIGNSSEKIKNLVSQRKKCEDNLKKGALYAKAPISGIVSYRIDGLEDLNSSGFNSITSEYLNTLNLKTGQIVSTSETGGKIIDNFKYYIITVMNSKEAKEAEIGKTIKLRLSTNDEVSAKIVHKKEEKEDVIIAFELDKVIEKLTSYRKISFDVIWWSDTGFKVPNQAIISDNGFDYVIRQNKSGDYSRVLVKINRTADNYSIIKNYSTEELSQINYKEENIETYKTIRIYDEIMLKPDFKYIQ